MDISEVCRRYKLAKERYDKEMRAIEEEYAASKYSFKKGDVVIFKNVMYKEPTICVVDNMHYLSPETICKYRYDNICDNIEVSGYQVDSEGYYVPFFKGGGQAVSVGFRVNDVIEVTNIQPKLKFR